MKKFLFLCLILCSKLAFCQDWIRYFGYGSQPHSSYCIEHYDKGYLLTGDINSYKYGWLIKTDINGNELWDIKIGDGNNQTSLSNVELTFDMGLIISGTTSIYNYTHSDPFIMKLNNCGGLEWCKALV